LSDDQSPAGDLDGPTESGSDSELETDLDTSTEVPAKSPAEAPDESPAETLADLADEMADHSAIEPLDQSPAEPSTEPGAEVPDLLGAELFDDPDVEEAGRSGSEPFAELDVEEPDQSAAESLDQSPAGPSTEPDAEVSDLSGDELFDDPDVEEPDHSAAEPLDQSPAEPSTEPGADVSDLSGAELFADRDVEEPDHSATESLDQSSAGPSAEPDAGELEQPVTEPSGELEAEALDQPAVGTPDELDTQPSGDRDASKPDQPTAERPDEPGTEPSGDLDAEEPDRPAAEPPDDSDAEPEPTQVLEALAQTTAPVGDSADTVSLARPPLTIFEGWTPSPQRASADAKAAALDKGLPPVDAEEPGFAARRLAGAEEPTWTAGWPDGAEETAAFEAAQPNPEEPAEKTKPKRRHRALKWSLAAVFVLVAGAAGGVVYANHYYSDKALPGATLAGLPVAGQTEAELEQTAAKLVGDMKFTFTAAGATLTGNAEQLGVAADPKAVAGQVLATAKGQPLWRKLNPWTEKPVPVTAEVDEQALRQFLDAAFIAEDQETTDAAVAYDPETASFTVVPSFTGLRSEIRNAVEAIEAHLADTTAPAQVEIVKVADPPAIDDAAAQAAVEAAVAGLERVVTFDNGQDGVRSRTYQLPAASIATWTVFTPDQAAGTIEVGYDSDKIAAELPGLLADKVAIASRKQIVMTYPDSDQEIGVAQWGLNGLRMADPEPVIGEVTAALAEGRDVAVTVPLETDPFETEKVKPPSNYDEPDGAAWIDVNKSTFIATLYAGTTPVGSYVISIGKPGHDTPSGTFYVYLKYEHQVMRGPASDPYESPTNWVSYFTGGVAFHSAPWNEPNNWQRRVSHGCVNMKTRDAKVVFDFAPIGTKVVVHD
jgi:hypothetical protein